MGPGSVGLLPAEPLVLVFPDGSTPKWGPHSQRVGSGNTSTSTSTSVCVYVCVCVCVCARTRVYVCGGILEAFIALSAFWVFLQVPKISKKNGGPFLKQ